MALLLRSEGIAFERQVGFAEPERHWRADFRIGCGLLIEVEGLTWFTNPRTGKYHLGGHQTKKGYTDNCEKYNAAVLRGYALLRFTEDMINDGRAVAAIRAWLAKGFT